MSTKVYNGLAISKRGAPWDLLWAIQNEAQERIQSKVSMYYADKIQTVIYDNVLKVMKPNDWQSRLWVVANDVQAKIKQQAGSLCRNEFDVDVSVTVSPYKGRFYLRTFCDPVSCLVGGCLDFLKDYSGVEDFHYQDSEDKPEYIPARAWQRRRKVWDSIFSPDLLFPRQVTLNILDAQSFHILDPWLDLSREYHKSPPALKPLEELAIKHLASDGYLNPKLEATSPEPGVIQGQGFEIMGSGQIWTGKVGEETWQGPLKDVVGGVKAKFFSDEEKAHIERLTRTYGRYPCSASEQCEGVSPEQGDIAR